LASRVSKGSQTSNIVGCGGYLFVGGLFGNALATFMGYSPKALRTGFGAEAIATIDVRGYGVFLPDTWVVIQS